MGWFSARTFLNFLTWSLLCVWSFMLKVSPAIFSSSITSGAILVLQMLEQPTFSLFFPLSLFFFSFVFSQLTTMTLAVYPSPARSSSLSCKSRWNSLVQSHLRLCCGGPFPKCNDSVRVTAYRLAHLLINTRVPVMTASSDPVCRKEGY